MRKGENTVKGAIAQASMYVELTHSQPKVATRVRLRLSYR